MVKIIVCMKQVLDPEAPVSSFGIDPSTNRAIPAKGTPPVLSPFDENALEAALRIKDLQDTAITVINMGFNLAKPVIRRSLATGADELILLEDDDFGEMDSYSTAYILAAAIQKIGMYDLILCGRQAADTDAGQVGSGIAEILGIPSITIARKIDVSNRNVRVERVVSDGYEVIEAPMPALVTVSNEVGDLRSAKLADIIAAQKKMPIVWNSRDLDVDITQMKRANLLKLFQSINERKCEIIRAENVEQAVADLTLKLKEEGLI